MKKGSIPRFERRKETKNKGSDNCRNSMIRKMDPPGGGVNGTLGWWKKITRIATKGAGCNVFGYACCEQEGLSHRGRPRGE